MTSLLLAVLALGAQQECNDLATVKFTVSPYKGQYTVADSSNTVLFEGGGTSKIAMSPGGYTVVYRDIGSPYKTPNSTSFKVTCGNKVLEVNGYYEIPGPYMDINVKVKPAKGRYIIKDSATGKVLVSETMGNVSISLPKGHYTVEYLPLPNHETPPSKKIAPDTKGAITGTYYKKGKTGKVHFRKVPKGTQYEIVDMESKDVVVPINADTSTRELDFGKYIIKLYYKEKNTARPKHYRFSLTKMNQEYTVHCNVR